MRQRFSIELVVRGSHIQTAVSGGYSDILQIVAENLQEPTSSTDARLNGGLRKYFGPFELLDFSPHFSRQTNEHKIRFFFFL